MYYSLLIFFVPVAQHFKESYFRQTPAKGCVDTSQMYGFLCRSDKMAMECCSENLCNEGLIPTLTPSTGNFLKIIKHCDNDKNISRMSFLQFLPKRVVDI